MTETRTANGDLTFSPRSTDVIVQVRDNLRYWEDRVNNATMGSATALYISNTDA
jgi:hypothetical protein